MCGIAFDARRTGQVDEPALWRGIESAAHRGPDRRAVRVFADAGIGIAHARLSIVDLSSAGNQPMANEDESLWLVCNGEIYNHGELRGELQALGHHFRSASDNEILLHGYEQWGLDVLGRVRGMFAFALAEPGRRRLLIARDRLGEKPLVLVRDEHGVAGASEIPGLLAAGRGGRDIDPRALAYYLARNLRHVPEPLSIFADVEKLPPAHFAVVEAGAIVESGVWWRPSWRGARASQAELAARIRDAVALQRDADVEVGALLSGGVDSSVVVGLAAGDGRAVRTYALGADGDDEELLRARRAAARFGTRHTARTFAPAQLARLEALIGQLGEPIALLPLTHADVLLEAVADNRLRVVLTGNGADELLWGYSGIPRLRLASLAMRAADALPPPLKRALARALTVSGRAEAARVLSAPMAQRKIELYRRAVDERADLLAPEYRDRARMPPRCPVFGPWADLFDGEDYIELSQFLTLVVEDAHSVTITGDLVGMHHSVEMRSPFLDHLVAEAAFRLPIRQKAGSLLKPNGKRALKEAFHGLLGPGVATAPKMGFGHALMESELIRGPFRELFTQRIGDGRGIARYFDRPRVMGALSDHMAGAADHGKLLLGLYAFEIWHERFGPGERGWVSR